jgi:hypothetical protein
MPGIVAAQKKGADQRRLANEPDISWDACVELSFDLV